MTNEINVTATTKEEIREHVGMVLSNLSLIQREFLRPLDPSESEDAMKYCRDVARAFDEVVMVITNRTNDESVRTMLHQATEIMLQNLIDYHNEEEEKH